MLIQNSLLSIQTTSRILGAQRIRPNKDSMAKASRTEFDPTSKGDDDLFEFLCAATAAPELFAADDVIIGGKLPPLRAPQPPPLSLRPNVARAHVPDPSSELGLRRSSSLVGDRPRGGERLKAKWRPRWYALVLVGNVDPSGMEMGDIRIRRRRRWRSGVPVGRQAAENPSEWDPWKLLKLLSCKGTEAISIVA